MDELRKTLRGLILSFTGFIVFTLLLRVFVDFIFTNDANLFSNIVRNLTTPLIEPFSGIVVAEDLDKINLDAIVAMGAFLLIGIFVSEIISAFLQDSIIKIIRNLVDAFFKIVEGLLFLRIIFTILMVKQDIVFVDFIYSSTSFVNTLLPLELIFDNRFDIAAFILLIIVSIFDYLTDRFLDLFDRDVIAENKSPFFKKEVYREFRTVNQAPQVQESRPQNITINLPPANQGFVNQTNEYRGGRRI